MDSAAAPSEARHCWLCRWHDHPDAVSATKFFVERAQHTGLEQMAQMMHTKLSGLHPDVDAEAEGLSAAAIRDHIELHVVHPNLTKLAYGDRYPGVYPSCGGCDEFLKYFLYETTMTEDKVKELHGKCTGVLREGEKIKLKVIPLKDLWKEAPDGKAHTALSLYHNLKEAGKLK